MSFFSSQIPFSKHIVYIHYIPLESSWLMTLSQTIICCDKVHSCEGKSLSLGSMLSLGTYSHFFNMIFNCIFRRNFTNTKYFSITSGIKISVCYHLWYQCLLHTLMVSVSFIQNSDLFLYHGSPLEEILSCASEAWA